MSGSSRRKPAKTAKRRLDQGSDPKGRYKIRRKIPDPSWSLAEIVHPHQPTSPRRKLINDEQLAMPFVAPPRIEPQPFLKWVGGKASIVRQLEEFFPHDIDRYFEPFIGGGAVFFYLKHRFPSMRPFLRDSNRELINCYRIVRDRPQELMRLLDEHSEQFRKGGDPYFYEVRKQHDLTDDLARAARTIFLNKTCFNGLWRVNAKGEFNTPVGSNKNANLYSRENLLAASSALQDAQLEAQDFRITLTELCSGDFVYLDPPYVPVSATANFTSYTKEGFGECEQRALATLFTQAARSGVRLMLSNSDVPLVRQLYKTFSIHFVQARRAINNDPNGRGPVNEVVICAGNSD